MADDDLHIRVERLSGRVDGVEIRIRPLEAWVEESKRFHQEMRTHWDHWDGMQESEAKIQAERHAQNIEALQKNANRTGVQNLLIAAFGLVVLAVGTFIAVLEYQAHHRGNSSMFSQQTMQQQNAELSTSGKSY